MPKDAIGDSLLETKKVALLTFGYDGYGTGGLRAVTPEAKTWRFGGAKSGAVDEGRTRTEVSLNAQGRNMASEAMSEQ